MYADCKTGFEANDDLLMVTLVVVWLTQVRTMLVHLRTCRCTWSLALHRMLLGAISKNYEGPDIDVATVALDLKAAIFWPTALLIAERHEQKLLMSTAHRFHGNEMASQLVAIQMRRNFDIHCSKDTRLA